MSRCCWCCFCIGEFLLEFCGESRGARAHQTGVRQAGFGLWPFRGAASKFREFGLAGFWGMA